MVRCRHSGLFTLTLTAAVLCAPSVHGQRRPMFQAPQEAAPRPTLLAPQTTTQPAQWNVPQTQGSGVLPINLATALKLVNARAIDVAIASQTIGKARAQFDQARYAWLPTITAGADYLRHDGVSQDSSGNVITPSRSSFMAGFGVNAIVTPVDAIFAPLAARQTLRARNADLDTAANNTVLAVAEAYFNVQQARGDLAGAEVTLRHAEELVRRTEKLAPGIAAPVEAIRARTELARRRQAVQQAHERWQLASADLSRILRLDPTSIVEPIEPPHVRVPLIALDQTVDQLIPIGLRNRPELAAQQSLVEAALQRLKQERMRPLIPSLVLKGTGTNPPASFTGGVFGGGQDALSKYGIRGDVELQAIWEFQNLLFGNAAKIHERRADQQIAILTMFRLQDQIAADVYQAYAQAQSAARRVVDAEAGLKDAAESVEKNFQGLKQTRMVGEVFVFVVRPQEVLASVQALAQANADYYGAVADFNRAQFRLYRALGYPADAIHCEEPRTK